MGVAVVKAKHEQRRSRDKRRRSNAMTEAQTGRCGQWLGRSVMGSIRARVEIGAGGLGDLGSRKREARRCLGTEEVTAAATLMVVLWPCELVVICRFMGAATMVIRGRTRLGHGGDEY
jgi:hypothetical protein